MDADAVPQWRLVGLGGVAQLALEPQREEHRVGGAREDEEE
jgi:hypothetical protein